MYGGSACELSMSGRASLRSCAGGTDPEMAGLAWELVDGTCCVGDGRTFLEPDREPASIIKLVQYLWTLHW